MAAYLIGQIIIHDMEKFMPYVVNTSAAIAKYGGEVLDVWRPRRSWKATGLLARGRRWFVFEMKRRSADSGTLRRTRR